MSEATPAQRLGFLGARKALEREGGFPLAITLAASGEVEGLVLYLRAHLALAGYAAQIATLPFGALGHALRGDITGGDELLLLLPWDFVGALDWRTGGPDRAADLQACLREARETAALIGRRGAACVYLPAPTPPIFGDPEVDAKLAQRLEGLARSLGARVLPPDTFGLAPYLATGCPIAGAALERVAMELAADTAFLRSKAATDVGGAKVLVTDLDNSLWRGVVAEDGVDGLAFGPDALGWPHFLYQRLLQRLRGLGVVLVAVSRNRLQDVLAPFQSGGMTLCESDFVAIIASYDAKSAQIRQIAQTLNLDLASFVFVDDNPIELAEVGCGLPQLMTVAFPTSDAELPDFLGLLAQLFARSTVTGEDLNRTALYRRRMEGMAPRNASGAEISDFLCELEMRLVMRERTIGGHARALQLINKTNQFNLNGRRLGDTELATILTAGGRLFTGELFDRTGSHGEVLALLVSDTGLVESFVMSCRVFLRQAEAAFFLALTDAGIAIRSLSHTPTERNEPARRFLAGPGFKLGAGGRLEHDAPAFEAANQACRSLIAVSWETTA